MKFVIGFSTCLAVLLAMSQACDWGQDDAAKQCDLTGLFVVHDKIYSCHVRGEE